MNWTLARLRRAPAVWGSAVCLIIFGVLFFVFRPMNWILALLHRVPSTWWAAAACLIIFGGLHFLFRYWNRNGGAFYFDPQDFVAYEAGRNRELPVSARTGTFAPLLSNYTDVTKLLITVAAASIAFGGGQSPSKGILLAKVILAFSILYGVTFVSLLLFFYDDYCQNVRAHTPFRYSLTEGLGFSTLICFIGGYFVWAFNLG